MWGVKSIKTLNNYVICDEEGAQLCSKETVTLEWGNGTEVWVCVEVVDRWFSTPECSAVMSDATDNENS